LISSANSIPNDAHLHSDVCVVGGGPAGIALTLTLAQQGISVLLLESGFLKEDADTQALYNGEVVDERMHSPPDKYRQRRMGGSSTIWGGRCMPFDPVDFENRAHVPGSGWPISYADVLPYYPAANAWAEAGRFSYQAPEAFGSGALPMIPGFVSTTVSTDGLERFSCPTDFGKRYAKRLQVEPRVRVLVGANCTAVTLQRDGRSVKELQVKTLAGSRFRVTARSTVLAAGGLETARLLLASQDVTPQGVGNAHDVVGRYYMCHIAGNVGMLTLQGWPRDIRHGYEVSPEGIYCRRRISVTASEQRRLGLANAVARLHFPRITDPAHRNGVLSGLFLARRLISYEYSKRLNDGNTNNASTYVRHLMNVVTDPRDTTAFLAHWIRKRSLAHRKFPSVILHNRTNRFSLEVHGEQYPLRDSRLTLTDKRDALGMPQVKVDWRYCRDDIESVKRTLDVIALEISRSGVGKFEYNHSTLEEELMRFGAYGGHHVGTTRMGTDLRTSVVDPDCQVHGVRGLFIAGSAVFPTSSQANPTLTLIAMALRLADKLSANLRADKHVVMPGAFA
jgi:choline dehydrogenase-like flavoprotein